MLVDTLKKANIEAMKAKDNNTRAVLSVVLTRYQLKLVEAKAQGKEIGDPEMLEIIQKVLKELNDEKDGYLKVNNTKRASLIDGQLNVLKGYFPAQLNEQEIRDEIAKLDDKSMPSIMKHFKTNFAGKVNMSLVSQIARNL